MTIFLMTLYCPNCNKTSVINDIADECPNCEKIK